MDEETIAELFIKRIKAEGKITDEMVEEVIKSGNHADVSFFLEGLYDVDLSRIDMSNLSQKKFERLTFYSDKTIFSEEQKEKFNIEKLIEEGKSLNGIKSFQEKNINGEGTSIVLIDECFDSDIEEFKEAKNKNKSRVIEYRVFEPDEQGNILDREYNYKEGDDDGHHGKTTACLAAGNTCGIAPKAKMYLFGKKGKETSNKKEKKEKKEKMLEAMLEHIKENGIVPDIICMPDISILSDKSKETLGELEKKGCILLDSDKFWKDFSLGKVNEAGKVVPNDYMEEMLNMKCDEKSEVGKKIAELKENMSNTILFPADGRTTINTNKEGYKYLGSFCGASFAIAQVSGLFLLARQINKDISYDKFVEIAKETAKTNSNGMKYLDTEGMLTKIETMEFVPDELAKKLANGEDIEDVAMNKGNARNNFSELEKEQNKDKIVTISE